MKKVLIEACVGSVESAIEAARGGALRVELCDNLYEGGTTPSAGAVKIARRMLDIDISVMLRPRGGDFCYSDTEFNIMMNDLNVAKGIGADGVVFGILKPDGSVDYPRTRELAELAWPMSTTFHRAFDMAQDPFEALETLMKLGVERILTSGRQPSALQGAELLKQLVQKAGDRLTIMPGVGIDETNIQQLVAETNATEFHVLAQKVVPSQMTYRNEAVFMGQNPDLPEYESFTTDWEKIEAVCKNANS